MPKKLDEEVMNEMLLMHMYSKERERMKERILIFFNYCYVTPIGSTYDKSHPHKEPSFAKLRDELIEILAKRLNCDPSEIEYAWQYAANPSRNLKYMTIKEWVNKVPILVKGGNNA